jgi:hypothetical protein
MQPNLNIDLSKIPNIKCECGCEYWEEKKMVKFISKIISPNGQEGLVNIPVLVCSNCRLPITSVVENN